MFKNIFRLPISVKGWSLFSNSISKYIFLTLLNRSSWIEYLSFIISCYEVIYIININLFSFSNYSTLIYALKPQINNRSLLCLYEVCECASHRKFKVVIGIGLYLVIDSVEEQWLVNVIIKFHIIQLLNRYEVLLIRHSTINKFYILLSELIRPIIFISLDIIWLFIFFHHRSQLNK